MAAKDVYKKLGLTADDAGVAYWDGLGLSDAELEREIAYSAQQNGQAPAAGGTDRSSLINKIYYQELGRLNPDQEGLDYWNQQSNLSDSQLRQAIREAGGMSGTSVNEPLMADQDYAAFLRKMQFNESQIQSSLQAAQEAAARRIQGEKATYDTQRKQGAQNINSGYEARQNRSGNRLTDLGENRTQIDRSQLKFETGINESKAKMERDAAAQIAGMRRDQAEQQVAARDRLTLRSAGM
jgi:hypothetical protein